MPVNLSLYSTSHFLPHPWLLTSCKAFQNAAMLWPDHRFTWACGHMPCWGMEPYVSRVILIILVAVDHHSSRITALPGLVVKCHAGGMELCAEGSTCNSCCNGSSFWSNHHFTWACGQMPCWVSGTVCVEGSTCNSCCNGSSWSHCN